MDKYFYMQVDNEYEKHALKEGMTFLDVKKAVGNTEAICTLRNKELEPLGKTINHGDRIRLLASTHSESASRVFLRGATFLLHVAACRMGLPFRVEHVLHGGIYCRMNDVTQAQIVKLQAIIDAFIKEDDEFTFTMVDIDRAKLLLRKENMTQQVRLLKFRPFDYFRLYWFKNHSCYFHGIMPPSASYLKGARLVKYADGFIMKIPTPYKAGHRNIEDQQKYSSVFRAAERWAEQTKSAYIADLNERYLAGDIKELIAANEKLHEERIEQIAQEIADHDRIRVVLIAGPSSSGKTTFAGRLEKQLHAKGKKSYAISVDNYYRDRSDIERDEHGNVDLESINALDVKKLGEDLTTLLSGRTAKTPLFDFGTNKRIKETLDVRITDELIIIEGIHGLNDALTAHVDENIKFKIFISPLTALNFDKRSVVLPEDLRLLRRLARDKRTRGASFTETFDMWHSVRDGEYKYILPYQETAHVMFNSTLIYEPLVLKKYCYEDLQQIPPTEKSYIQAQSMLKFLNYFLDLDDESAIPKHSLLREFIGHIE
ncbi:MAG: adenylyl-sulfate kinase [Clostridia bacterium]|jgi:uridine kinase|nr:adenylyl-sulfate kinase [Clostridia bacterium]MBT7122955.1 adenylyl-sulfate kinase [Clostridia bacterium]